MNEASPARRSRGPGQPRLHLRVTAAADTAIRAGHPWVYQDSIREQNRAGEVGEIAIVYDRRDRFLAAGLFDPLSPLRLRVLQKGNPARIDAAWWQERLRQALARRTGLFEEDTNGFRWIHGENDGWPGLVMDQYARTLVIKLYTLAWLPHWETILPLFREALQPERVVLRLSRHVAEQAPGRFGCSDGEVVWGTPLAGPVVFTETGLKFQANVLRGQKTGFFLDQRENRRRVGSLAEGRRVLNLFSFSGGFSLYAAQGGASDVLDVDISAHALKAGEANFELNRSVPGIAQCRRRAVRADTFEWLQASTDELYDLVVVDPPSLARRESERPGALQAYRRLAEAAIQRLTPGGVLVAASCSAHVAAPEFFKVVREAAQGSGRRRDELGTTLEPPDHPATFPEAAYLKCIYLRLGGARWK